MDNEVETVEKHETEEEEEEECDFPDKAKKLFGLEDY